MLLDVGDHRVGDALRASARVRPAACVSERGQQQPGRRTREGGLRRVGVRDHPGDERRRLLRAEGASCQGSALVQHPDRETRGGQRIAGDAEQLVAGEVDHAVDVAAERTQT